MSIENYVYCDETSPSGLRWKIQHHGRAKDSVAGYINDRKYWIFRINGKTYKAHRVIFEMHFGKTDSFIDHVDGDRSNNKLSNLRAATVAENAWNSRVRSDNCTGIKGLSLLANGRFRAQIKKAGVMHSAYFINKADATTWLNNLRKKLHGNFSNKG